MGGISLSAPQGVFLNGMDQKFRSYVGGFGSGKTFVGCLDLLIFASKHPMTVQGYFAPTYRDIRDTFWPTLAEAGEMLGFRVVVKKADKEVTLYRGKAYYGTIICRSMDDPAGIVGFKIARALVDEIDVMPAAKAKEAWNKIIARMRLVVAGAVNGIGVTTTPEGFKFVYQTWADKPKRGYAMVQASTHENAQYLPADYISSLRDSYPSNLIDAYLLGKFVNLTSGSVYRFYDRARCRSAEVIRPDDALHIGQDFNVGKMASVVYVWRGSVLHAVGELTGLLDTPALIETLKEKFADHAITVYPDASGGGRKTVDASRSDLTLLKAAGFTVVNNASNPAVKDRVNAMNKGFEKSRLMVNDTACPTFALGLEQQAYDKNGAPDKSGGNDHLNDAGGYPVVKLMPVRKPAPVSAERLLRRRELEYVSDRDDDEVETWKVG